MPEPVLLVHGAFHGAWCWTDVLRELTAGDHHAVAVDLPGAGLRAADPPSFRTYDPARLREEPSPVAGLTAEAVEADVAAVLTDLHERFGPVTVVAHSVSGVLLHRLGEHHSSVIRRLVYVAAAAPTPGVSALDWAGQEPFAGSLFHRLPIADPAATGAIRIDWRSQDPAYRELARRFFYNDLPPARAEVALRMLTSDAPVTLFADTVELSPERWGSLPRRWIRCAQDLAVPVAAQSANIADLDGAFGEHPFDVVDLDSGHSPFLSVPVPLAHHITRAS